MPFWMVDYINASLRGIAWDAPLPEVKRDDNAPVVDEDASEDELLAVFKWHVVYRGQKRLAKQLGVDESLVHRWLNRPPNVTHWIWDYTYCYLGGIGADDPIPHREEIGWAKSANQIWLRDPTGVEVAKRLQRKAS